MNNKNNSATIQRYASNAWNTHSRVSLDRLGQKLQRIDNKRKTRIHGWSFKTHKNLWISGIYM